MILTFPDMVTESTNTSFDADSIDESLVTDGIHFNKENIAKT